MHDVYMIGGILLGGFIFVGALTFHAAFLIPSPALPSTTDPALLSYRNTVRTLGWVTAITLDLAVAFTVTVAWIVGMSRAEIPEGTRRGTFTFAAVLLVVWLVFSLQAFTRLPLLGEIGGAP